MGLLHGPWEHSLVFMDRCEHKMSHLCVIEKDDAPPALLLVGAFCAFHPILLELLCISPNHTYLLNTSELRNIPSSPARPQRVRHHGASSSFRSSDHPGTQWTFRAFPIEESSRSRHQPAAARRQRHHASANAAGQPRRREPPRFGVTGWNPVGRIV